MRGYSVERKAWVPRVSPWLSWAVPPSSRTLRGLFSLGFLDQMFPDFDTSFGPRDARSVRAEARERGAAAWPEWRVYIASISGALKVHLDPSRATDKLSAVRLPDAALSVNERRFRCAYPTLDNDGRGRFISRRPADRAAAIRARLDHRC